MEYLVHLLKHTTLIEWGMFALAFLIALVLYTVSIVLFFRARKKMTIAIVTALALVPMFLCVATIAFRYFDNQRIYKSSASASSGPTYEKYVRENRADYVVAGLIGIVLVLPSVLIGTAGMIKKRPSQ